MGGWRLYLQQRVLPAAFALALLYLTVLSLGLLMTAYLKWLVGGLSRNELVFASLSKPGRDIPPDDLLRATACAHLAQCGPVLRGLGHLNLPCNIGGGDAACLKPRNLLCRACLRRSSASTGALELSQGC